MKFHYSTYRIKLHHPFTISRSSHDYYDIIYIYLTHDGITGVGEAAPSGRYGESFEQILKWINEHRFLLPDKIDNLKDCIKELHGHCSGIKSLMAAFDIAAHDLWGKLTNTPIYEYYTAYPLNTPMTSFTIGIDSIDVIKQKVTEAEQYPILKIKLGTEYDKEIVRTIRRITNKPIRVDANEGWNLDSAKTMIDWLADKNIEFIEQPLPAYRLNDMITLKVNSPLKLFADENSLQSKDIPGLADAFHGINIKLMKCGGLVEASRMITTARKYNLEIMFGCMIESSVAVTAAAHLSPFVDFADLDGNILIKNDPYRGVRVDNGKLILPKAPGLGVKLK